MSTVQLIKTFLRSKGTISILTLGLFPFMVPLSRGSCFVGVCQAQIFKRELGPQACILCLWKGQGHQGIFSLVKDTPMRKLSISTGAFQGHQGNDHGAWGHTPLLPLWSIRPGPAKFTWVFPSKVVWCWKSIVRTISMHWWRELSLLSWTCFYTVC